jgi:predicted nucleic acid-binding protein
VVLEGKKKTAPEASLLETLFKEKKISVHNVSNTKYVNFVKEMAAESEMQPLHEAEAEVLCLTKELDGLALADDYVVRSVARILGIELHGTGYVLGKIFATGDIDKEKLIEKVKEMRDSGWYVSAEDYLKIIDYLKNL